MTLAQYGLYSLLGIAVVFAALALLMVIVKLVGLVPDKGGEKEGEKHSSAGAAGVESMVSTAEPVLAPGSAGSLKLYDTDPRDAAMIMAIVADELEKPLNELRFLSIKEVKR